MTVAPTNTLPPSAPSVPAYRPNALLRWLLGRFFRHIDVDTHWAEAVEAAAKRGTVVYVMRSLSMLDFLCLDYLTKARSLPLIRFVNELRLWIFGPFAGKRHASEDEEVALGRTLEAQCSALLFLRKPPKLLHTTRKGERIDTDLVRTLVEAQRKSERPILLVPQTFIWGKLAGNQKHRIFDYLLGPIDWPGRLRTVFRFLLNYRNALLRTGDDFDLKAFLDANPALSDTEAADKVRYALLRRMERERALVVGPRKKTPERLREEIVKSPKMRKHIDGAVRSNGRPLATVEAEVDKELKKLCAAPDELMLSLLHRLLDRVWNKIYDGIDIDMAGIERVREAARHGPLILLPSHKSHVDYLVLSDVFYSQQLSPPLIAAGDNLSFFPLGWILRRGGAFFIRRSFKGKKLYSALVDTYMRRLLVDGHHIEVFIEGGRSRTGKLLPPKFGILSMLVDACLALRGRTIHYVPISVGYELIVEQQSYMDELAGADKQKENIGGLLKTPEVLRSRYGRLYIQFGEVMPFDKLVDEALELSARKSRDVDDLSPDERRALVQRIGHRATYEINRVTVVTPAALVSSCLMTNRRRGISRSQLDETATQLRDVLKRLGARLAPTIDNAGPINSRAIDEAMALLRDGKLATQHGEGRDAVYAVPEERRPALEYYKNNVLHFFVPSALISAALLVQDEDEAVSEHSLRERVRKISRLFKYDFMYRADTDFDQIFSDALNDMLRAGELERLVDRVRPADGARGERIRIYAQMLRTYFEAYFLAAKGLLGLPAEGVARKDWLKRTMTMGQRLYLAGELENRESLAKPKLETALSALRDHGLVKLSMKGNLEPAADASHQLESFIEQLRRYLR
jgi:glycerol-3-phosphate O-acyltransferase